MSNLLLLVSTYDYRSGASAREARKGSQTNSLGVSMARACLCLIFGKISEYGAHSPMPWCGAVSIDNAAGACMSALTLSIGSSNRNKCFKE